MTRGLRGEVVHHLKRAGALGLRFREGFADLVRHELRDTRGILVEQPRVARQVGGPFQRGGGPPIRQSVVGGRNRRVDIGGGGVGDMPQKAVVAWGTYREGADSGAAFTADDERAGKGCAQRRVRRRPEPRVTDRTRQAESYSAKSWASCCAMRRAALASSAQIAMWNTS